MKIKHISFLIIALYGCTHAFTLPPASAISAKHVIPDIINSNFSTALTTVDSLIKTDSTDPFPFILKLSILGMRDVDFDRSLDSALFLSTYDKAIQKIDFLELKSGKSSYSRMMAGFSKAIHSAYYLRNKSYVSAMKNGFDALDLLREAREIDSTNTEVLMFLGLYDFARAELRSKLWWVLFWYPGNRSSGIEKLKKCSVSSILTKTAAKLSLSEVYIKENKINQADSLLRELEKLYPESRFVFWSRVKYYEAQKKYSETAEFYEKLSLSYLKTTEGRYNYFITKNQAAHMWKKSGNLEKALSTCQSLLSEPDSNDFEAIRKDTQRLLNRVNNTKHNS